MTTPDFPEDNKITQDEAINALRTIRELLETVSVSAVAYRHALKVTHQTVHEQAARIAKLEATEDELCVQCNEDAARIAQLEATLQRRDITIAQTHIVVDDKLKADNRRMMTVIHQANEDMAAMRDRLGESRSQYASPMATEFADLIINARTKGKEDWIDIERARTNRIATGIRNRINDGHNTLAIIMCETLIEETQ